MQDLINFIAGSTTSAHYGLSDSSRNREDAQRIAQILRSKLNMNSLADIQEACAEWRERHICPKCKGKGWRYDLTKSGSGVKCTDCEKGKIVNNG